MKLSHQEINLSKSVLGLALLAALQLWPVSHAQTAPESSSPSEPAAVPVDKDLGEAIPAVNMSGALLREMLTSEIRAQRGELKEAAQTYLQLGKTLNDSRFARRATQWLLQAREIEKAFEAAQMWNTQAPESVDASRAFEALALANNQYEALAKVLEVRLASARKNNALAASYERIVRALAEAPNRSAASDMFMSLSQRDQERVEGRFARSEWQVLQKNWPQANLEIEQALALAPADQKALWLGVQIAAALKDSDLVIKRTLAYRGDEKAKLPTRAIALLGAGQMLEDQRKYSEAQSLIALVDDKDENYFSSQLRLGQLEAKRTNPEAGIAQIQKIGTATNEQKSRLVRASAQIMRDADRNDDALKLLGDGLRQMPDNHDLLYEHALAAEKLLDFSLMEKQLRRLIELKPDDANAYNALGYSFADRNVKLDEAETLLREALRLNPNSGAILDSLGWVLFRKGQYNESIELLRAAFARQPDAEVAAHLGEAMWAIDQREIATRIWRAAAKEFAEHPVLKETMKRYGVAPNHIQ